MATGEALRPEGAPWHPDGSTVGLELLAGEGLLCDEECSACSVGEQQLEGNGHELDSELPSDHKSLDLLMASVTKCHEVCSDQ